MKCILCGTHVATGEAFLIMEGDLHGDGTFTVKRAVGALCEECGDPDERKGKTTAFPFTVNIP